MQEKEKLQKTPVKLKYLFEKFKSAWQPLLVKIKMSKSDKQDLNFDDYDQLEAKRTQYTLRKDQF